MLEFSQFESAEENGLSYAIAVLGFIAMFAFILIPVHYFRYRQDGAIETRYLAEVYDGFKDTAWSKLYMFIFILRRFAMAFVVVFMRDADVWIRCSFYTLIQIAALVYTFIVKPFDESKDNLIEIINEVTYTLVCLIITVCNEESKWFDGLDSILIFSLMIVGLLIGIIINIDIIIGCIQSYKEKQAEKRAEELMENGEECVEIGNKSMDNARRPTEEPALNQESEPDQPYQTKQSQIMHKTIKQAEYSNVNDENPDENENENNNSR